MKKMELFKFELSKDLLVVMFNYILVVSVFYLSFQIITIKHVAGQFISFGIIGILLLGIITPAVYTTQIKKRPLSSLGIKKEKLLLSILLSLGFSIIQYNLTLANLELPGLKTLLPLVFMVITVGLFENIFFRGFVQLRLEKSFGIIPGIFISALIYSLYHVGYGMATSELWTLFIVGVAYSIIFRLTSNIFILFPILTPMGAIFTNIKEGLIIPFESIIGFTLVILSAVIVLIVINRVYLKQMKLHKSI